MSDYEFIKTIGKGGFSNVYLVRRRIDGLLFAVKSMNKELIKKWGKVEYVMNERSILGKLKHPFLMTIHSAF